MSGGASDTFQKALRLLGPVLQSNSSQLHFALQEARKVGNALALLYLIHGVR